MLKTVIKNINDTFLREVKRILSRPVYIIASVFVMTFSYLFFLTFFEEGLPQKLPIGIIDNDNSYVSRTLLRNVDALPRVRIVKKYVSFREAREDMQEGKIYGIIDVDRSFESDLLGGRQPQMNFYINDTYLVAGSLAFKDLTYLNELGIAYVQQKILKAKGIVGDENTLPIIQPIAVDRHLIANPYTNYGIYLLNVLLPGVLQLIIIMLTIFCIGVEFKEKTALEWYFTANKSTFVALVGKMLPYTFLFLFFGILSNLLLYGYMNYPMNGSLITFSLATVLYVLASQAIGLFIIGLFTQIKNAISVGAFYSIFSFTFAGFTFPIESMPYKVQIFANFFPIRHYFKIYVNEVLNGVSINYSLFYYIFLIMFLFLPFVVYNKLSKEIRNLDIKKNY